MATLVSSMACLRGCLATSTTSRLPLASETLCREDGEGVRGGRGGGGLPVECDKILGLALKGGIVCGRLDVAWHPLRNFVHFPDKLVVHTVMFCRHTT